MCLYDSNSRFGADCLFPIISKFRKKKNPISKFPCPLIWTRWVFRRTNPLNRRYLKNGPPMLLKRLWGHISSPSKIRIHRERQTSFFEQSATTFFGLVSSLCPRYKDGNISTFAMYLIFWTETYEDIFNCLTNIQNSRSMVSSIPKRLNERRYFISSLEGQVGYFWNFSLPDLTPKRQQWVFSGRWFWPQNLRPQFTIHSWWLG